MSPQTSGWYNESYRHGLASRSIKSVQHSTNDVAIRKLKLQKLEVAWKKYLKLRLVGAKLISEGSHLWGKGSEFYINRIAEPTKIQSKGAKLQAEGEILIAEGNKLQAKSKELWAKSVLAVYGNVIIDWRDEQTCIVEGIIYEKEMVH